MRYMLMMHAPRGNGDWGVMNWKPEELKAHIEFMMTFNKALKASGELVGAEEAYEIAGRASAAPGPGGTPLNMPIEVRQVMSGPPPVD